jgi:hypothetical protein
VDAGRTPGELADFPADRAVHELPGTVRALLVDIEVRAGQVRDLGKHGIVECTDASVAALRKPGYALGPAHQ